MEAYNRFAYIYDELMQEVPYDSWVKYIEEIFNRHGVTPKNILELGCGTGNITIPMAKKGYRMLGLDLSEDMLNVAARKAKEENVSLQFMQNDMIHFEIGYQAEAVLALCDSLNYILEEEDLLEVFHRVYQCLSDEGLFIFDLNTIYKFSEVLEDHIYVEHLEEITYIWENHYDSEACINEYHMTFFQKNNMGSYDKFEEYHEERGYEIDEIKVLLDYADFECLAVYHELSFESPKKDTERVYFIGRKRRL